MSTGFDRDEPGGFEIEDSGRARRMAAERTNLPGIFLIVVAILNLLAALGLVGLGFATLSLNPEEFEKALAQQASTQNVTKDSGYSAEQLRDLYGRTYIGWGAIALLLALVTLFAGVCMRGLRLYGLAITGAIFAALPCISPMGCCLLGEAIGLWAILVLINPAVRSAFRRAAEGETAGGADTSETGSAP
jgi:hypothetical protein